MRWAVGFWRRLLYSIVTIFLIISISFMLVHLMPGEPIVGLIGQEEYYYLLDNNPEELERLSRKYGLKDPLFMQYGRYLQSVVKLDFGYSHINHEEVGQRVIRACFNTLLLSIPTWIIGGLLGGTLGLIAGWKPKGIFDRVTTPIFLLLYTIPSNCIALLLLILFSYKLRLFPINGMVSPGTQGLARTMSMLRHMTLPLFILILMRTAGNFMLMKSAVSQIREEEYILTASSKGLSEFGVLFRHVLRNALLTYGTSMAIQMGFLLSGSLVIETVFGWKGMGQLMLDAVNRKDFPTAQLCFLLSAICVVGANWIGESINMMVDPRLRDE